MSALTPEQWRGELLRDIWQFGPTSTRLLMLRGERVGLTAAQVEEHLAVLHAAGLVHVAEVGRGPECYGPALDAEDAARREYGRLSGAVTCRVCGCSDNWACDGGCWWAGDDLCTSCVDQEEGAPCP